MFGILTRQLDNLRHRIRSRRWQPHMALGRRGEDLAHRYLQRQGFIVADRNWTTVDAHGEIDIIAWEGDILVFVEVKTRVSSEYGDPARALDRVKRRAMTQAAFRYRRVLGVPAEMCRFDLVTITGINPPVLRHERGALLSPDPDRLS